MMMMMILSSSCTKLGPNYMFSFPYNNNYNNKCVNYNTNNNNTICMSNSKKANLIATKKDKIKIPIYDDDHQHHISKFLAHPSGVQSVLNTGALQNIEYLDSDSNIYRCTLSKLELFNFQAAPVIDLRVSSTDSDCTVELLSCKFIGSKMLERQNEHFSAFMRNRMTWDTNDSESFLELDVKLNLTIEVYTRPFTLLPASAVERPGNLMMQALVDRLVPLLMQQLLQDYDTWVRQQQLTKEKAD